MNKGGRQYMHVLAVVGILHFGSVFGQPPGSNTIELEPGVEPFRPEGIGNSWSVLLASVDKIEASSAEDVVVQEGYVTLNVEKLLYGADVGSRIKLPYRYDHIVYVRDTEGTFIGVKSIGFPRGVWGNLKELKKPNLLIVLDPKGEVQDGDGVIHNEQKVVKATPVDGVHDLIVQEL